MTIKTIQRIVSSFFVLIYSNKINSYLLKINLRGNLKTRVYHLGRKIIDKKPEIPR